MFATFKLQFVNLVMGMCVLFAVHYPVLAANQEPEQNNVPDISELGMEALLNLDVTSVTKSASNSKDVPSAIYVLTAEEIHRTGATTIPEALRVVPGIHVARIDGNRWAVSARGFSNQYANKLLVLMDGRSLYSPMFSGVWWDQEDVLMDDIDRIEVIRGSGASLWGANAVNGVINIITKKAKNTQGGLVVGHGGSMRKGGSLRYGVELGNQAYLKIYGRHAEYDESFMPDTHASAGDDGHLDKLGFRLDKEVGMTDKLTVQGDFFSGHSGGAQQNLANVLGQGMPVLSPPYSRSVATDNDMSGHYVLGRWEHRINTNSSTVLRAYWNSNYRNAVAINSSDQVDTVDFDFQHNLRVDRHHNLIWGAGARLNNYSSHGSPELSWTDKYRFDDIYNLFAQDEITLVPERWKLTLGSKFEHNPSSRFEWQPNVRLSWTPLKQHAFWASVARSVRTPSWTEQNISYNTGIVPPVGGGPASAFNPVTLISTMGNKKFGSEKMLGYELGWRGELSAKLSADVTLYYYDYHNILSASPGSLYPNFAAGYWLQTIDYTNLGAAQIYGGEASLDWKVNDAWKLRATYSQTQQHFNLASQAPLGTRTVYENSFPNQQAMLWSMHQLTQQLHLDLNWRFVNNINVETQAIASYQELDARLGWEVGHGVELAVVGRNLINDHHQEFGSVFLSVPTAIQREVYATVRWNF